jgi:hypothetical protein
MDNENASYEEINRNLANIAQILDKHFNPVKKVKWDTIIISIIIGIGAIVGLYLLYLFLQPLFNYNLIINY